MFAGYVVKPALGTKVRNTPRLTGMPRYVILLSSRSDGKSGGGVRGL